MNALGAGMPSHCPQFALRWAWRDAFILIFILSLLLPKYGSAEPLRQAPNTRVAMAVDKAFVVSNQFTGFVDKDSGAFIDIVEKSASAYGELKKLAEQPYRVLTRKGITNIENALLSRNGEYVYIVGRQKTPTGTYVKFLLIMREKGVTAMITTHIPEIALRRGQISRTQIERMLSTATVQKEGKGPARLFRLDYLGSFKEVHGFLGVSRVFSLNGYLPDRSNAADDLAPLVVVTASKNKKEIGDLHGEAFNFFKKLSGFKEHEVISAGRMSAGGLEGYTISGEARDIRMGTKKAVYIAMFARRIGGYYVLVAYCPLTDANVYLPEFERMATSFKPLLP
jgi:hypothetical protein